MEALFEYTLVDPNRNVFDILILLEASASPQWNKEIIMNEGNYTNLVETYMDVSDCHSYIYPMYIAPDKVEFF